MNAQKLKLLVFFICFLASAIVCLGPLADLLRNGHPAEYYTHIPIIPIISAYVFVRRRSLIFQGDRGNPLLGLAAAILGLALLMIDKIYDPSLVPHVELTVSGGILFLVGSFIFLFGKRSFVRALFPFLFLIFLVPLPITWMERIVNILTAGSAALTELLLEALHIPLVRESALLRLPGFDLEVARECSGIRSSIALVITSVLAGQILLRRRWKKIVLTAAVLPITIFKNAIRIITLYVLAYFVDIRIIEGGFLHRSGGFLFFGLGLFILAFILWVLKSPREAWRKAKGERQYQ